MARRPSSLIQLIVLSALLASARPMRVFAGEKIPRYKVPLRIRVALCPDSAGKKAAVMSETWVKAHVLAANLILMPNGVELMPELETFTPKRCQLLTRAHRDAMARHVVMDGKATVLVLPRVRDVDVLTYNLMGVHWRYKGKDKAQRGKRWVFITKRSLPPVLAHELCHYFGLPHDKAGGNLMTPGPSDAVYKGKGKKPKGFSPTLTKAQGKWLRRGVRRFLKSGK